MDSVLSGKSPWQTHQPQSMGVVPPGRGYDAEVAREQGRRCCGCCSVDRSEGAFASSARGRAVSQNLDSPRPREHGKLSDSEESDLICPISIVTKGVKTVNKRRCGSGVLGKGSPSAPSDAARLQIAAQQINCRLNRKAYLLGERSSVCFSVCNLNCSLSPGLSFGLRIHSLPQGTRKLLGAPSRSSSVLGNVALPLRHL